MLYRHKRLERKLSESGAHAQAKLLNVRQEAFSARRQSKDVDDLRLPTRYYELKMLVMPPGEDQFEVTVRTRYPAPLHAGMVVDVIFDPANRDKLVVAAAVTPTPANAPLTIDTDPELAELDRLDAAAPSTAGATAGASDRIGELQELADLHDRGVLTDAEFAAEKTRILSGK